MLKLSIIIPCYNCEKTLQEAVDSCFSQGFSEHEFEIILVNDASTDSTATIMHNLESRHKNIKLAFHETNKGGGATRNTAAQMATADVLFCLDSDDILPPLTLQKMYTHLITKGCAAVGIHHSIKFIGSDKNKISHTDSFSYTGERIPISALLEKGDTLCSLYSVFMFRKTAFETAGGYPTEHGFDTQGFAWRFLTRGLQAETCPEATYLHRIQFHESYYLREANAGKVNFNWQQVLGEHLPLFTAETQSFIEDFPCYDFTRNLWVEFKNLPNIFNENYLDIVKSNYTRSNIKTKISLVIRRNSLQGIFLRLVYRLRKFIKNE